VKVEIGGAGIFAVDRQIGRDLMEQEGFVVGEKAFVRAIVESLRAVGRLKLHIPIAIDGYKILTVQAERIAVRASKAWPFEIDRSMYVHWASSNPGGEPPARLLLQCTMRISRQRDCAAAISAEAAANVAKLLETGRNPRQTKISADLRVERPTHATPLGWLQVEQSPPDL
jgi:hypothetical protein